ncbi:MAG: hypothetical protein ABIN18_24360 [Pseudomonadota bacterium]
MTIFKFDVLLTAILIMASTSLYEWNYPKQLLHIRLEEQKKKDKEEIEQIIYSPAFLLKRPLLEAILRAEEKAPVLLIDEIDRSDEEFEAFLLEVLSDFQITIPEIGTMKAKKKRMVVVTSNRAREVPEWSGAARGLAIHFISSTRHMDRGLSASEPWWL